MSSSSMLVIRSHPTHVTPNVDSENLQQRRAALLPSSVLSTLRLAKCHTHSVRHKMSTITRTLRNLRRIGLKQYAVRCKQSHLARAFD